MTGEYNHNDTVDAADYFVWRKGLDTAFTQNDYDVWRANFGQTSGSGAGSLSNSAVPEPTTAAILLAGIVAMSFRRRAQRGAFDELAALSAAGKSRKYLTRTRFRT